MDRASEMTKSSDGEFDFAGFLRAATHEVANPLNAISMNAELAKSLLQRDKPAQAIEALERLLVDCTRCGRTLRAVQRFGSHLKSSLRETVQLRALIDAAVATYLQDFSGTVPALHVDTVDQSICVRRTTAERVLADLLLNAAEAEASAIRIHARCEADLLTIEISDNGRGIPAEMRSRVVEPFFTTLRAQGHNGLGLPLADTFARAHGGDFRISENVGGGTQAVLRLCVDPTDSI